MEIENIIIECVNIFPLQNKPITQFLELANVHIISSFLKLINDKKEVKHSIDAISLEINSLFDEYFSCTNFINIEVALKGNCVELCILYLILIYISLLSNGNLRNQFFSSPISLSSELKLTYLLESIQKELPEISHEDLEILVQKNLDFVMTASKNEQHNDFSPQNSSSSTVIKYQSPLRDYLQLNGSVLLSSPSIIYKKQVTQKNREIHNLRQQIYSLEDERQHLQDTNAEINRKKERKEKERKQISDELKSLMKEYEESTNSALKEVEEDKKVVLNCHNRIKFLETENKYILQDSAKITKENTELLKQLQTIQSQLHLVTAEKYKLREFNETLQQDCTNNESLFEVQSVELRDIKNQLEKLRCFFQDQYKLHRTIDDSVDDGSIISDDFLKSVVEINTENSVFIERALEETRLELKEVKQQLVNKIMLINNTNDEYEKLSQKISSSENKDVVSKQEYNKVLSENTSLLVEIESLKHERTILNTKISQLEEDKKMINLQLEEIDSINVEQSQKYVKVMEKNRSLLEKIALVKDEKENIQILLNTVKVENSATKNKHNSLEGKIDILSSQKDLLAKELEDVREDIIKKEDELGLQNKKISEIKEENMKLVTEVDNCHKKLCLSKDNRVDVRKDVLSMKEDALKNEQTLQKTIDTLTNELHFSKEKITSDKKLIQKMKYEMEKIMKQVSELGHLEKDTYILSTKYENCKINLQKCNQQIENMTADNKSMELELNNMKMELIEYKNTHSQSTSRLNKLEDERQPLKSKLVQVEQKLKLIINERNSLIVKLKMAETSLRAAQKGNLRSSYMTDELRNGQINWDENRGNPLLDHRKASIVAKEKLIMEPPPSRKPMLRSSKTALKKVSSEVNFISGRHSTAGMTRTKSVACRPARMSDYNFNIKNVISLLPTTVIDEEQEQFTNNNLAAIQTDPGTDWKRMSELQRRNSMYPPHLRCVYTAETQYQSMPYSEDNFRSGDVDVLSDTNISPHGYNLRKRSMDSSFTSKDGKVRRVSEANSSSPLPKSQNRNIPVNSSLNKKSNISSPSPKLRRETRHGLSPANKVRRTPSTLSGILKCSKSPWKRLHDKKEDSPSSGSRKRIFRNPFGSKNYNVRSASMKNETLSS